MNWLVMNIGHHRNFERSVCRCLFAVHTQMIVMIEGEVMPIVWMAMMTVWYAAEQSRPEATIESIG